VLENHLARELRFADTITSEEELRAAAGQSRWFVSKILPKLDASCRSFIAKSPFMVIASSGEDGRVDASPKGDQPGFVRVLDDYTLAIPDRDGNRRFETFHNLLTNANVGLIFFVPGHRETLRVGGKASVVRDLALRQSVAIDGKIPNVATIVSVERAHFHCGSCIARSKLWEGRS
jgi:PPOX class probable FMN-dependent enzyme